MSGHVHRYPPGWLPEREADLFEPSEDMDAWRFCPPCGAPLIDSGYVRDDPQCSTCKRPYSACPCACVEEGVNVSGRSAERLAEAVEP